MSVLNGVLNEEYNRINKIISKIDNEIYDLPKGYISKKKINGKVYFYLQKREGEKIVSRYLPKKDEPSYRLLIDHRKELEGQRRELIKQKKKIEKVIEGE